MTLFKEMIKNNIEMTIHGSNLQIKDTPLARTILKRHGRTIDGRSVQEFTSKADLQQWLDIPFAYQILWDKLEAAK